jgi:hypothetical protein
VIESAAWLGLLVLIGMESASLPATLRVAPTLAAAPEYELRVPVSGVLPVEAGVAAVALEGDTLAIRAKLIDRNILARGDRDQLSHFKLGDTLEIFLKPDDRECYWEIYVTPHGNVSCFFRRDAQSPATTTEQQLRLRPACVPLTGEDGVRNGWIAELRFPVADLAAAGGGFALDGRWRILIGRYNHLDRIDPAAAELSSFPALPERRFHYFSGYATLRGVELSQSGE